MPKPKARILCVGVDPGVSGGIATIYRRDVELYPMPESLQDTWQLFERISDRAGLEAIDVHALIEKVSTSPQMGVKSAGTFMQNRGELLMALTAAGIPFEEVLPRKWQSGLSIPPRKKDETPSKWKGRLRQKAQQLYPRVKATLKTADSLLIAEYLRRVKNGEVNA